MVGLEGPHASTGSGGIDAQHLEAAALARARAHVSADAPEHAVGGRGLVEARVSDNAAGLVAPAAGGGVLEVAARGAAGGPRGGGAGAPPRPPPGPEAPGRGGPGAAPARGAPRPPWIG